MIGHVWGWTADPHRDHGAPPSSCCTAQPDSVTSRQVIKGGSHLCAPNDCQRYRPAARMAQPIDTSTSHVGFRCVRRSRPDHMEGISDA